MHFAEKYEQFLNNHMRRREGNRLLRLKEGHGHGEKQLLQKVWWPAIGNFDYLHPEYEVSDFRDGVRYLDFAYIRPPFRINLEIDGFGTHGGNIDRWKFADNLLRQNHLVLDGWKVIRLAYEYIEQKPRLCQQIIQQMMGRWFAEQQPRINLSAQERDVVRIAARLGRPVAVKDIRNHLQIGENFARRLLQRLMEAGIMKSVGGGSQRIHFYGLVNKDLDVYL